jgi:hypothetical protein
MSGWNRERRLRCRALPQPSPRSSRAAAVDRAKEVVFFSIGTNDLTQHKLAVDRSHETVADECSAADPAAPRFFALEIEADRRALIEVGTRYRPPGTWLLDSNDRSKKRCYLGTSGDLYPREPAQRPAAWRHGRPAGRVARIGFA